MKVEAKKIVEILEQFASDDDPVKEDGCIVPIKLGQVDCAILTDYIFELEEENKKLKDGIQEVKRVGDFLKESECMLDGEYYIVHSDIVIELDKAIKKLTGEKDV